MILNTTHFRITSNDKFLNFYLRNTYLDSLPAEDYNRHTSHVVISRAEGEFAVSVLRGNADFAPWFDDIGYLVRFTHNQIRVVHISDHNPVGNLYFAIPTPYLIEQLTNALASPDYDHTATPAELAELAETYAPRFVWEYSPNYYTDKNDSPYPDTGAKLTEDLQNPNAEGLQDAVNTLEQIARNYSDGKDSVIRLSFDEKPIAGIPTSYTFGVIDPDGNRIMYGGVIAHRDYAGGEHWYDNPLNHWRYSIHT